MAVTSYYTVGGQILAEKTSGAPRVDYLTDALGSVTATVNQSAQVVNTYRYKPYGALLAKTGAGTDPTYRWVGALGYRHSGSRFSEVYVRARHYSAVLARWSSPDPLYGTTANALYAYAAASPAGMVDPTGLFCQQIADCCDARRLELGSCRGGFWANRDTSVPGNETNKSRCEQFKQAPEPKRQANCDLIASELKSISNTCVDMCQSARDGNPPYGAGSQFSAVMICCYQMRPPADPVPKVCGIEWCNSPRLHKMNPCVKQCIEEHEWTHANQPPQIFQCPGTRSVPPVGIRNRAGLESWAECDAYRVEVYCLRRLFTELGCEAGKTKEYLAELQILVDRCDTAASFPGSPPNPIPKPR